MTAENLRGPLAGKVAALLVAAGVAAMFVSSVGYRLQNPSRVVATQQQTAEHGTLDNQEMMTQVGELMGRLQANPQDIQAMVEIGKRFVTMESFDRAESFAKRALAVDPDSPEALNLLGITAFRQKHLDEAEKAFLRLTELDPQFGPAHYNLGLLYRYHMNRPEDARKRFELAARHAGDNQRLKALVDEELSAGK